MVEITIIYDLGGSFYKKSEFYSILAKRAYLRQMRKLTGSLRSAGRPSHTLSSSDCTRKVTKNLLQNVSSSLGTRLRLSSTSGVKFMFHSSELARTGCLTTESQMTTSF